jgi:galactokinase
MSANLNPKLNSPRPTDGGPGDELEGNVTLKELAAATARKFAQQYGRPPRWMAAAPGRVNLIGEHVDYNDGFVLPLAIEMYAVLAADRPPANRGVARPQIRLHCARTGGDAAIWLDEKVQRGEPQWANYVRGVIAGFQQRGLDPGSFDALLNSTVPLGGGLSSSAALEVSTATLIEAMTQQRLDPVEKALMCQWAEHQFAGVPCGIMDQFISTLAQPGHLLLLDCRSRTCEQVPMNDPSLALLIVNTNVRHELSTSEYAKRRAQCETAARQLGVASLRDISLAQVVAAEAKLDPVVFRRARHVVTEIQRTLEATQALRQSAWSQLGGLMYASHDSLRDDYEVSCSELDLVVQIARGLGEKGGVYGCRMTGGGFGGCAVCLARADALSAISRAIRLAYEQQTKIRPAFFSSRPAGGAQVL